MIIKVLSSGSLGNCYIITNDIGEQLILECGVKIEKISVEVNYSKVKGCLYSHKDLDHSLSLEKLELFGIDCFGTDNLESGKIIEISNWQILPIQVKHRDIKCFSYIIKDKISNKKILFCTDLEIMPNIADTYFDIMLLEANFSEEIINIKIQNGENFNRRCFTHNSLESLVEWLKPRKNKPKSLVLIHLSTSGLINGNAALETIKEYTQNSYLAKAGLEIVV